MHSIWRVVLGFIISPVIPCALSIVPNKLLHPEWTGYLLLIGYELIACYVLILLFALPTYVLLQGKGQVNFVTSLATGLFIGTAVGVAPVLLMALSPIAGEYSASDSGGAIVINNHLTLHGYFVTVRDVLQAAVFGASISTIFWVIAVWKNTPEFLRDPHSP